MCHYKVFAVVIHLKFFFFSKSVCVCVRVCAQAKTICFKLTETNRLYLFIFISQLTH